MRRVLLDTSVLVPALVRQLDRHSRALPYLQQALRREVEFLIAAHSLAELYAALTRLPASPRISPKLARRLIQENVLPAAEVVALSAEDYQEVVRRCADLGLAGGAIYDALIARAADSAGADELVTFNVEDFRRVWPEGTGVIRAP